MYLDELRRVGQSHNTDTSGSFFGNTADATENAWILYTIIGACVLISFIALVILYDLCYRYREHRDQQVFDGGPPSTPGHHFSYTVAIKAEDVSAPFDTQQSIIKLDLIDSQNRYLTSVAVPCFIFKFSNANSRKFMPRPNGQQVETRPLMAYKSMSALIETWSSTTRSNLVTFYIVRRNPLQNFSSVRVSHDCYLDGAKLNLKYIIIRDDRTQQCAKIDLQNKPISAYHPCPPSGFQVFSAERVVGPQQLEETRTLVQLMTAKEISAIMVTYVMLTITSCNFCFYLFRGVDNLRESLGMGLLGGTVAAAIMGLASILYSCIRRCAADPYQMNQAPVYALTLILLSSFASLLYSAHRLATTQLKSKSLGQFTLYFCITVSVALTIMILLIIMVTIVLSHIRFHKEEASPNEVPAEKNDTYALSRENPSQKANSNNSKSIKLAGN